MVLTQRATKLKEEMARQRLLAVVPSTDADGNIDPDAKAAFESTLASMIDTYVAENEQMHTRLNEITAECDEYKKKYNNLRRRQDDLGHGGAMADSHHSSSFNELPVVQSARQEIDDQKKLADSAFARAPIWLLQLRRSFSVLVERNSLNVASTDDLVDEADEGELMEVDSNDENAEGEDDADAIVAERQQGARAFWRFPATIVTTIAVFRARKNRQRGRQPPRRHLDQGASSLRTRAKRAAAGPSAARLRAQGQRAFRAHFIDRGGARQNPPRDVEARRKPRVGGKDRERKD